MGILSIIAKEKSKLNLNKLLKTWVGFCPSCFLAVPEEKASYRANVPQQGSIASPKVPNLSESTIDMRLKAFTFPEIILSWSSNLDLLMLYKDASGMTRVYSVSLSSLSQSCTQQAHIPLSFPWPKFLLTIEPPHWVMRDLNGNVEIFNLQF